MGVKGPPLRPPAATKPYSSTCVHSPGSASIHPSWIVSRRAAYNLILFGSSLRAHRPPTDHPSNPAYHEAPPRPPDRALSLFALPSSSPSFLPSFRPSGPRRAFPRVDRPVSRSRPAFPVTMSHQQTSRSKPVPAGNEEASSELKLGEFQNVDTLTLSEAALVINALVAKRRNDRKNMNETE